MSRARKGSRAVPEHVRRKREEATRLRQAGLTYVVIAKRVGYNSPEAACQAVKACLLDRSSETGMEAKALELRRLDELLSSLWPAALAGDDKAANLAVRLMERRAKYLGLDAKTTEERGEVTPLDDLAARRAARRSAATS